ncbi:hypothetical protein Btru_044732 [Bulinus truncatus]|nr:hypothetical protein Btru_044732 [Bulinus truncatus]
MCILPGCYGDKFHCGNVSSMHKNNLIQPLLSKNEASLLLLLGFGGLSILLAFIYVFIRRKVFNDHNNLDSTFDAGGNVSASLSAVTIASQMLWPADLMQSVTVAVKYGIAGGFWYCASCLVSLALFPLLSFKFKTRAPGAKTYLQIILARYGRPAHTVFCVYALLVNLLVLSAIIVCGTAVFQITIKDVSPEYSVLVMVTLCGSYSFIGGLGSTFYVSYFNALVTCVVLGTLLVKIFYSDEKPFGSLEQIYYKVNCSMPVPGNKGGSYFTFLSEGSILFAVQGFMLSTSLIYCDQANWQSRIAAKPLQGAIGFLVAGSIWFTIPASISMVTALTYIAEVAVDSSKSLTAEQIDSGIVSTYMSEMALGHEGGIMMLTMLTMLTMSTGSGEIMAVSSIIVYDIYQTYICPYRFKSPLSSCVFCGLVKPSATAHTFDGDSKCQCPASENCQTCKSDTRSQLTSADQPGKIAKYTCPHHGDYRLYQDKLIKFKSWCILWVTLALIPYGLILNSSGIDLNWLILVGSLITIPALPSVILSITWSRLTSHGVILGSLVGMICGLASNVVVAYGYYKGEGGFFRCTSEPYAVVAGSTISVTVTLVLTVSVSLYSHQISTAEDEDAEWEKLRNIDNPLHPWAVQFGEDFPQVKDRISRPSYQQMESLSKNGRLVAIIGCVVFFIVYIVIIPGTMASLEVLSVEQFKSWVHFINVWFFIMAVLIIIVTPIEEVRTIWKQITSRKQLDDSTETSDETRRRISAVVFPGFKDRYERIPMSNSSMSGTNSHFKTDHQLSSGDVARETQNVDFNVLANDVKLHDHSECEMYKLSGSSQVADGESYLSQSKTSLHEQLDLDSKFESSI